MSENIQLSHTVENDMDVNVPAFVMAVSVCTDQDLMSGKVLPGKPHPELMSQFCCQFSIGIVLRIEADDIVVRFNI